MLKIKQIIFFVIVVILNLTTVSAQSQEILKIDGKSSSKEEFIRLFFKNRLEKTPPTAKEIDDYLNLFINFKLKVAEAESRGMDTLKSFKKELAGYRAQLTKPYFSDNKIIDSLVLQAYERMKTEVHAQHILIRLSPNSPPEDTLRAYEKAMSIRNQLVLGNPFTQIAKEFSDDPSASANGGDLGYFTALQMVYPFENTAYTLKIDSISYPTRTRFGYHLIKVIDRRPARGKIKVAHIMKIVPKSASPNEKVRAKKQIDSIYVLLEKGQDFADLAQKYSDDRSSGTKGGELPWFGAGRMIPVFENAAFSLQNKGEYTKPIQTSFGWHIIKLLDKKGLKPFDDMKDELYSRVKRDSRAQLSKVSVINKLKKEYHFQDFNMLPLFYANVDSTIFYGGWQQKTIPQKEKPLFHFKQHTYTIGDFANFLYQNQPHSGYKSSDPISYVTNKYNKFIENKLFTYEDSQLEKEYPDFYYLMKEYHDGILLFNITDKAVWSKSLNDSIGLKKYFKQNETKYRTKAEVSMSIFSYQSKKILKKWKKIRKNFDFSKEMPDSNILLIAQIYDPNFRKDTSGLFKISDEIILESGLNKNQFSKELSFQFSKTTTKVYYIRHFKKSYLPPLTEIKSIVASDYQTLLEDIWIKSLKEKHQIQVDKEVYQTIKQKILSNQ